MLSMFQSLSSISEVDSNVFQRHAVVKLNTLVHDTEVSCAEVHLHVIKTYSAASYRSVYIMK